MRCVYTESSCGPGTNPSTNTHINSSTKNAGTGSATAPQEGAPSLLEPARNGDEVSADRLLDKGADPNKTSKEGRAPLLAAVQEGHLPVTELLLAKGADPNKASKDGHVAL